MAAAAAPVGMAQAVPTGRDPTEEDLMSTADDRLPDSLDLDAERPADADAPAQRPPRAASLAASALAAGALTLPDPARLAPGPRHLLRLGRAAYVGWYSWASLRHRAMPEVSPSVFGAVAGAGLTLASAPVDEATDAWLSERLRRLRVGNPRLALALAGAGMGALLALDTRPDEDEDATHVGTPEDFFDTVEVPATARALVEAMTDAALHAQLDAPVDPAQAEVLRAQLDAAQASVLAGGVPTTDVFFEVPEDLPRLVPHHQTWPVRGHFEAGGVPLQLELQIGAGRLAGLSILQRDEDLPADDERWEIDLLDVLEAWPTPEQVRWVVDRP